MAKQMHEKLLRRAIEKEDKQLMKRLKNQTVVIGLLDPQILLSQGSEAAPEAKEAEDIN